MKKITNQLSYCKNSILYYLFLKSKLKLIGITGTNGKGTTTLLIKSILKQAGYKTAIMSSLFFYDGRIQEEESTRTTLNFDKIIKFLQRAKKNNCKFVVMEVSSHGIKQNRTGNIQFDSKVLTNLSREHLEYHPSLEDYYKTKLDFIIQNNKSQIIINNDNENIKLSSNKMITFGIKNKSEVMAENIKFDWKSTEFLLKTKQEITKIKTNLIGLFNVYNILAAISVGLYYKIPLEKMIQSLKDINFIEGRFEVIKKKPYKIIIDDAHNNSSLKTVLKTIKKLSHNKIITIFGCGGFPSNNDKGKRWLMGRTASRLSDYSIITNDNPRDEDPSSIVNDIIKGFKKENYEIILDRKAAIKKAIKIARKNDVILVIGKGHEKYQTIKGKQIPSNDKEIVKEIVKK